LRGTGWLRRTITIEHLHDLGKLLFGFVVFWTYIAFCQYFLIWCANLPEETRWYITRRSGTWNTLSWALCFGHCVVPFYLLLFRSIRRDPFWLGLLAAWVLVFHYLDLYWIVMPTLYPEGAQPDWLDASVLATLVLAGTEASSQSGSAADPGRRSSSVRVARIPQSVRSDSYVRRS